MNTAERDIEELKNRVRDHAFDRGNRPRRLFFRDDDLLLDMFISKIVLFALVPDNAVDRWIKERLRRAQLHSDIVPVGSIDKWQIDGTTGNISHVSGRFFSILGLGVRHRTAQNELVWDQPIIDQPEIGILGILAKKFKGVLHFCLQAKEEPGNIHSVQLSPTVQATYSNYTQAHGGTLPPLVEYFLDPLPEQVLFAKLQSEDGGRFLFKSNRNMIVLINDDIPLPESFIWLTLRQISDLMKRDNLINACARSVLAALI